MSATEFRGVCGGHGGAEHGPRSGRARLRTGDRARRRPRGASARLPVSRPKGRRSPCSPPTGRSFPRSGAPGGVTLRGAGPVGTFSAGRDRGPSIRLSAELDSAMRGAELVFVTGPVLKQRTYAMVLAEPRRGRPGAGPGPRPVPGGARSRLVPAGRRVRGRCGARRGAGAPVLDTRGRRRDPASHPLPLPHPPRLCRATAGDVVRGLARFLPNLVPVRTVAESGFADGSGLVEAPALLLGGPAAPPGGPELPPGAEPLPERNTFRALIGERHLAVIAAMAGERRRVAARWGGARSPRCANVAGRWGRRTGRGGGASGARRGPRAAARPLRGHRLPHSFALRRSGRGNGGSGDPGDGGPRPRPRSAAIWPTPAGGSTPSASGRRIWTTPGARWTRIARGER